jgi:RimK family alpha-L-glutamate ligase
VRVLNRAESLLAVHDKLRTSRVLAVADLPQPRTAGWRGEHGMPLEPPFVLKPRFGSWGRDVFRCDDRGAVEAALEVARRRPWFRRHGAMLQELVPPLGYDLRLIVAGGRVVGAGRRVAAEGEWRTNISLGGTLSPVDPPADARALAVAAGTAVGADLVGVDLLPLAGGGHVVIELNGAVEFDERYSVTKRGIFAETAAALGIWPSREEWTSAHRRPELVSPS